jgi:hypothetical protein
MTKTRWIVVGVTLSLSLAAGTGLCQQLPSPPPFELHAKDIRMGQPDELTRASSLCQQARQSERGWVRHDRDVDPATLEPDLRSLMEKSDEVILAGISFADIEAISPSGTDAAHFFDVKVLRTWKGTHKVGDSLTFAFPWAHIKCGPGTSDSRMTSFGTMTAPGDLLHLGHGPYVLFLRRSQGDEKRFMPGFQLTGGSGLQGMFEIPLPVENRTIEEKNCNGVLEGAVEMCRAYLEASPIPIRMPYGRDPLFKQYNGMPIYAFINEVQSVADSLGSTIQSEDAK